LNAANAAFFITDSIRKIKKLAHSLVNGRFFVFKLLEKRDLYSLLFADELLRFPHGTAV
jgi:hypothetical protein